MNTKQQKMNLKIRPPLINMGFEETVTQNELQYFWQGFIGFKENVDKIHSK